MGFTMKVTRIKMCKGKLSFHTISAAKKIAIKYDQRVYECPICFCYHTTSLEDWRQEFFRKEEVEKKLLEQKTLINNINQENASLKAKNSNYIKKIEELQKVITERNLAIKVRNIVLVRHKLSKEVSEEFSNAQ